MALTLFDNARSSNALKARFGLAVVGLAYERREVPFAFPRPDWYLAVNPVGGIPALADGDLVLSESNAILRYLATREGRDDLYPTVARERALVDEMMERWVATFRPAFFKIEAPALGFVLGKGMGAGEPEPEKALAAAAEVQPQLELLERLVQDPSGFAVLGRPTLADVTAAPILFRTTKTGLDLSAYPGIRRWRDTVTALPSFAAAEPVI
ncbi:MAG: glutathione S-transferase family protein [Actinobacteria bacterium]|nr:glutathione S-transferase family protein [Actinomycetota bacterium]